MDVFSVLDLIAPICLIPVLTMTTSMPDQKITRCYRYAIAPSSVQIEAIERAARDARRVWNSLVATLRYAEHEIEHGRRGSIQSELTAILIGKKVTGVAAVKAKTRSIKEDISKEDAARLNRVDQAKKIGTPKYTKSGKFLRLISNRSLAVAYAVESVELTRKKKGGVCSQIAVSLVNKFRDCCQLYVSNKRGAPKFKSHGDSISLQYQVTESSPCPIIGNRVSLDKLAGDVCAQVPIILHRPVPEIATIKQVALTLRGHHAFAVLMLDIIGHGRQFASTGRTAGIDPGRKIAMAVASLDGQTEVLQPAMARDRHTLSRMRRLQRKAARQLRIANPNCFNPDGTFRRGKRPRNKGANFRDTYTKLLSIQEHIANARLDYYHNAANKLLTQYDVIGVGKWRGKGSAPGLGKSRRAQNRKDYDHAISIFTGILKYKSEHNPKMVFDVQEHGSTVTCSCGARSGPRGLDGLKVREWSCSECGKKHNRDFHAAEAHAIAAKEMAAASVGGVARVEVTRKKGRRARAQTQASPQGDNVPVNDQTVPVRADTQINIKSCERRSDAPEMNNPVAETGSNIKLSGPTHLSPEMAKPFAGGKMEGIATIRNRALSSPETPENQGSIAERVGECCDTD